MAENISKLYRGGLWYKDDQDVNDTRNTRFEHVKTALLRHYNGEYDDLDLAWHIKNAVIGGVYISQTVFDGIIDRNQGIWSKYVEIDCNGKVQPKKTETEQFKIIRDIIEGRAKLNDAGFFDGKYLEIRKWTGMKYSGASLVFEHVIPAQVYLKELRRAYDNHEFNEDYFRKFRKSILVCIVTKKENEALNQWKNSMPILQGKEVIKVINKVDTKDDWLVVTNNKFNRYNNVDPKVIIHGLNI